MKKRRPSPPRTLPPCPPGRNRITPAEARRRAERHVLNRLFKRARVADGAGVRLNIYHRAHWKPDQVWVVYKNSDAPMALRSSDIIVVSKRTGRVLHEGSAGDEG